jgi:hypothetical protein
MSGALGRLCLVQPDAALSAIYRSHTMAIITATKSNQRSHLVHLSVSGCQLPTFEFVRHTDTFYRGLGLQR